MIYSKINDDGRFYLLCNDYRCNVITIDTGISTSYLIILQTDLWEQIHITCNGEGTFISTKFSRGFSIMDVDNDFYMFKMDLLEDKGKITSSGPGEIFNH